MKKEVSISILENITDEMIKSVRIHGVLAQKS